MYNIDALIARTTKLAPLPKTYYQLSNAINNPSTSLNDIGEIINQDPSLTAQLLRIANSAMFNFPSQINSVNQAITVIGIQQLRELTLACTVLRAFPLIPGNYVNIDGFWQHSLAVGIAARVIARHRKESNIERYYVLGLLHDIGRIVVYLGDPDTSRELLQSANQSQQLLHNLETARWEVDHGDISSAFLSHWGLPASIWEPLQHHHAPEKSDNYQDECATIHLADIIAHALELGISGEKRVPPLSDVAWQRLGLNPDQLPQIVEQIETQYHESVDLFKSNLH